MHEFHPGLRAPGGARGAGLLAGADACRRARQRACSRHRMAAFLRRPAAQAPDRTLAAEQPRPARRDPQHRAGARELPDPARRRVAVDRRRRQRAAPGGRQRRAGQHMGCRAAGHELRARFLRPRAQPEPGSAGAIPGDRGGPQDDADLARRERCHDLHRPARRRRVVARHARDADDARRFLPADEAALRQRRIVGGRRAPGRAAARDSEGLARADPAPARARRERFDLAGGPGAARRSAGSRTHATSSHVGARQPPACGFAPMATPPR